MFENNYNNNNDYNNSLSLSLCKLRLGFNRHSALNGYIRLQRNAIFSTAHRAIFRKSIIGCFYVFTCRLFAVFLLRSVYILCSIQLSIRVVYMYTLSVCVGVLLCGYMCLHLQSCMSIKYTINEYNAQACDQLTPSTAEYYDIIYPHFGLGLNFSVYGYFPTTERAYKLSTSSQRPKRKNDATSDAATVRNVPFIHTTMTYITVSVILNLNIIKIYTYSKCNNAAKIMKAL